MARLLAFVFALLCLLPGVLAQGLMPVQSLYAPFSFAANAVGYAPNGKTIAVGAGDGNGGLQLFTSAGAFIKCLPTTLYSVSQVVYSPDGTMLLDGGSAGALESPNAIIELWDVATGTLLWSVNLTGIAIYTVGFSPDGTSLVDGGAHVSIATSTGLLETRSVATGAVTTTYSTSAFAQIQSAAISPTGKTIAAGGNSTTSAVLQVWNVGAAAPAVKLPTKANRNVGAIAFSPDGTALADSSFSWTGSQYNGYLEDWNVSTGKSNYSVLTTNATTFSVAYSPDGKTIAQGGSGSAATAGINLFAAASGKLTGSIDSSEASGEALAFSPDNSTLASAGYISGNSVVPALELWKVSTQTLLASADLDLVQGVVGVAFSPNETTLAVAGTNLSLWNVQTGALKTILVPKPSSSLFAVAYSPDGTKIACAIPGGVQMYSASTGELLTTLYSTANYVVSLAFSHDGMSLVDGGTAYASGHPGVVEVWNVSTGKLRYSLPTQSNGITSVAFSSDNVTIVDGGYGAVNGQGVGVVELWNASTGALIETLPTAAQDGVNVVAISPDGTTVADAGDGGISELVEIWNIATAAPVATFKYPGLGAQSLAYEPDGKVLLASFQLGGVLAYGTAPYALIGTYLQDSIYSATSMVVSPSGKYLACDAQPFSNDTGWSVNLNPYYGYIPATGVTLSPPHVLSTVPSMGTVTISGPAPSYSNIVSLSSGSPSAVVPAFLTIPAGQTSATFPISTSAVKAGGAVPITASSDGARRSAGLTITSLVKLVLSPTSCVGGQAVTGTLTLTSPAPAGGATVALSSNASWVSVPASVSIAAGSSTVNFAVKTSGVAAPSPATVTASLEDTTLTAGLTVNPAALVEFVLSPVSLVGGSTSIVTGTVKLNGLAPSGGDTVTLGCSNPLVAVVPGSVVVAAGSGTMTFSVSALPVTSTQSVTITASFSGVTESAVLSVTPLIVQNLVIKPASVVGGSPATGIVELASNVSSATTVTLSTSSSVVSVPSTVVVPAGSSRGSFGISTSAVASSTMASVTATLGSSSQSGSLTITPPALASLSVSPTSVQGSSSTVVTGTVKLTGPAPVGGTKVSLKSSSSVASVPATVVVAAGASSATFTVGHKKVSAKTGVTLTATLGSVSKSVGLTVTP